MNKHIHLIWIGETVPDKATESVKHWQEVAPDHKVTLYRDTSLLMPEWQSAYDKAQEIQSKCDLLRLSILRQIGGWYFDVDIRISKPLKEIESECNLSNNKMFITLYGSVKSFPQNDVLHATPDWLGWEQVDAYVQKPTFPNGYMTYGLLLLHCLRANYPMYFAINTDYRYQIKERDTSIFLRRGQQPLHAITFDRPGKIFI